MIKIRHSQPSIKIQDIKAVDRVLKSGNIACGEKVEEFERLICSLVGTKYAAAVNSGTSALHLALFSLGVKAGDEVIIPTYCCQAILNAVLYTGAQPVLVDIKEEDFNLNPKNLPAKITKKTKAIILPHLFGQAGDMDEIKKFNIPLIEDGAQALGAKYKGKKVGSFGLLSVFSFYATKIITTGEGGMVLSNSKKLINRIKDLREYDKKDKFIISYNYKMTDFQAALGISQLKRLPYIILRRRQIAKLYEENLKDLTLPTRGRQADKRIRLPSEGKGKYHIFYRYVIQAPNASNLISYLFKKGVEVKPPVYKSLHKYLNLKGFPVADKVNLSAISLPIYPQLSNHDVHYIIKSIKEGISK